MDEVVATLRSIRGLKPGDENNFSIVTQTTASTVEQGDGYFFLVMLVLSSIGLMVGGVGVIAIHDDLGDRAHARDRRPQSAWEPRAAPSCGSSWSRRRPSRFVAGRSGCSRRRARVLISRITPIPANVPLCPIVAALPRVGAHRRGFGLYPASRRRASIRLKRCATNNAFVGFRVPLFEAVDSSLSRRSGAISSVRSSAAWHHRLGRISRRRRRRHQGMNAYVRERLAARSSVNAFQSGAIRSRWVHRR